MRVRPGERETRANFFRPVSILIRDDLPTFDLPVKAISGLSDTGQPVRLLLEEINFADLIIIMMKAFIYMFSLDMLTSGHCKAG